MKKKRPALIQLTIVLACINFFLMGGFFSIQASLLLSWQNTLEWITLILFGLSVFASFVIILGFYKKWSWTKWMAYFGVIFQTIYTLGIFLVIGDYLVSEVNFSRENIGRGMLFLGMMILGFCFWYLSALRKKEISIYFGTEREAFEDVFE